MRARHCCWVYMQQLVSYVDYNMNLYYHSRLSAGAPILTANATFQLMSSYPQLVFSLTCSTTGYPPTIVSLSRDNDQLDLSSEQWTALQELTNRPETDYTSTLMLNTSDTAGYAGTYNFTLSNTGGSTFSTISLIGMHLCEFSTMCVSVLFPPSSRTTNFT